MNYTLGEGIIHTDYFTLEQEVEIECICGEKEKTNLLIQLYSDIPDKNADELSMALSYLNATYDELADELTRCKMDGRGDIENLTTLVTGLQTIINFISYLLLIRRTKDA